MAIDFRSIRQTFSVLSFRITNKHTQAGNRSQKTMPVLDCLGNRSELAVIKLF